MASQLFGALRDAWEPLENYLSHYTMNRLEAAIAERDSAGAPVPRCRTGLFERLCPAAPTIQP